MIEYKAILSDGSEYSFNGSSVNVALIKSLTLGESGTTFENILIDKSSGPGSVKIGTSRIKQRSLSMKLQACFQTDSDYNAYVNSLISALLDIKYLVDVTNERQTEVACSECVESHVTGAYKRVIDISISFEQLTPYWEDVDETEINFSTVANTPSILQIVNSGNMPAQPKFTLHASIACASISIAPQDNNMSISIEDFLFGSTGYTAMILDNALGSLEIGIESSGSLASGSLDRKQSIVEGSGFIEIARGTSYLSILSIVAITGTLSFKPRYYR